MNSKLLSRKKSELDVLGKCQPFDRPFWYRAKGVAGQPFAKEIRSVTPETNLLPQQKPEIEMLLSRKDLWRALISKGVDPFRRPTSTED